MSENAALEAITWAARFFVGALFLSGFFAGLLCFGGAHVLSH